jgi:serine/threonine-protein kinase
MNFPGHAERGGWHDASRRPLRPGTTLGRYQLLVPIGVGGMACVWAARLCGHAGFSKLVAIKTILPHLNYRDFEDMLLDEARIVGGAHHPNVCDLLDVGKDQDVVYLVLEWVNGDSLLHLLRGTRRGGQGPLDYRIAARIVADGCAGLHAAHELTGSDGQPLRVVHRDVSPHNLLVSLEGVTKIADFGIAKAQGQLHQITRAGEIRGKLAYMAPEQTGAGPVDRRADVFAMGCVLYQATVGRPPFRGESDAQVIRAVLEGSFEPPVQADAKYPPELASIVERALAHDADDRYPTAEYLRAALEAWLACAGSGSAPTAMDVAALVHDRIGDELGERRERVRCALESLPPSESTRPVPSVAPAADSGVQPTAQPIEPAPLPGSAVPLLPLGSAPRAPPPRATAGTLSVARPLKVALAAAMGVALAVALLLTRTAVERPNVVGKAAVDVSMGGSTSVPAIASAAMPAAVMRVPESVTTTPAQGSPSPRSGAQAAPVHTGISSPPEAAPHRASTARPLPTASAPRASEIPANPY